jgi:hypothetical protein
MLTIVFVIFIALFAVAGVFITIDAKRGGRRATARAAASNKGQASVGRATPGND